MPDIFDFPGRVAVVTGAARGIGRAIAEALAARELGRKGITVNAVAPGMVLTEIAEQLPE